MLNAAVCDAAPEIPSQGKATAKRPMLEMRSEDEA